MAEQKQMKIEFKDRKMIITHPSGHVDKYDQVHLKAFKQRLFDRQSEIQAQIESIVNDISKL